MTKEQAKMFFDSDVDVLKQAFESDKEYANITQATISAYVSKIFEVLILKGILTEEEAVEHLEEASKIMKEQINKLNGREEKKDD